MGSELNMENDFVAYVDKSSFERSYSIALEVEFESIRKVYLIDNYVLDGSSYH